MAQQSPTEEGVVAEVIFISAEVHMYSFKFVYLQFFYEFTVHKVKQSNTGFH